MYVFDDEAGPLCPEDEAQRIAMLAAAGLTLQQLRAWQHLTDSQTPN